MGERSRLITGVKSQLEDAIDAGIERIKKVRVAKRTAMRMFIMPMRGAGTRLPGNKRKKLNDNNKETQD